MRHPYERPCHGGECTEKGMATTGFCQCKREAKLLASIASVEVDWKTGVVGSNEAMMQIAEIFARK